MLLAWQPVPQGLTCVSDLLPAHQACHVGDFELSTYRARQLNGHQLCCSVLSSRSCFTTPQQCPFCLAFIQAAADVLAMASLEVDLSGVEEGQTVTVKWRGKPVFIRHRTDEEISEANQTPLSELRDPQPDAERVVDPKVGGKNDRKK